MELDAKLGTGSDGTQKTQYKYDAEDGCRARALPCRDTSRRLAACGEWSSVAQISTASSGLDQLVSRRIPAAKSYPVATVMVIERRVIFCFRLMTDDGLYARTQCQRSHSDANVKRALRELCFDSVTNHDVSQRTKRTTRHRC